MFYLVGIIDSILNLSGYEDKTISNDESIDLTNTYDTYGIQMEVEHYDFSENDTTGISGDYLRYFKMSFDTDKIDALIAKYGVDASSQDPNKEVIQNLKPFLEADNITENSVTLYPSIPYINTDPNYKVYCYVYRSTTENGTYEKISDAAVNCLDEVGIVDDNLKSNTTYYYKTAVVDGSKFSDILEITTESTASSIKNTNISGVDESVENPQTGAFLPVVTLSVIMIGSIIALVYTRKKSILKKI